MTVRAVIAQVLSGGVEVCERGGDAAGRQQNPGGPERDVLLLEDRGRPGREQQQHAENVQRQPADHRAPGAIRRERRDYLKNRARLRAMSTSMGRRRAAHSSYFISLGAADLIAHRSAPALKCLSGLDTHGAHLTRRPDRRRSHGPNQIALYEKLL